MTDLFVHVSLSPRRAPAVALVFGFVALADLLAGRTGELFKRGTVRRRGNGTSFQFYEDTYEVRMDEFEALPDPVTDAEQRVMT